MKKRIFIAIGILISIAIVLYFALFFIFNTKASQAKATTQSEQLINVWGNYTDEASGERLASLKPYLSTELYASYQEDFAALAKMKEKFGPSPESKITIESVDISQYNPGSFIIKITGTREFPELNEKNPTEIEVEIKKIMGKYKIVRLDEDMNLSQ